MTEFLPGVTPGEPDEAAEAEATELPAVDEPPASGEWVDSEDDVLATATDDEIAEGNRLGASIDPDDDDDAGVPV